MNKKVFYIFGKPNEPGLRVEEKGDEILLIHTKAVVTPSKTELRDGIYVSMTKDKFKEVYNCLFADEEKKYCFVCNSYLDSSEFVCNNCNKE